MDVLRKTADQFKELLSTMSASQRVTLIAVPVLVVGALGVLMYNGQSSNDVAVSWGKLFTSEEITGAEQTLQEAGMEYRREGQRIMVPVSAIEASNALLLAEGGLPNDPISEWEKKFESQAGVFTSKEHLQTLKDIALRKELRRVLRAIPAIQDADVIWARSRGGSRWDRHRPKVTATVNLRPRRDAELSLRLVSSLRSAVANMVPDLDPSEVTVMDIRTGEAFVPDKDGDPLDSRMVQRIKEFSRMYRSNISNTLSYIPNVLITVDVNLDNLKSSIVREQKLDTKSKVAVWERTQSRTFDSTQSRPVTEPGNKPNKPASVNPAGGNEKTQKSEITDSDIRTVPSFVVTEKQLFGAMPKAVKVSVQIPDDYYQAVANKQQPADTGDAADATDPATAPPTADLAQIQTEVETNVKAAVAKAIGLPAADEQSVTVTTYVRVAPEVPEMSEPMMDQVGRMISEWGGAVGLALFAMWALWMLQKSTGKVSEATENPLEELRNQAPVAETEEEAAPTEPTERDRLQLAVRDNPEAAATVLSKWIQTAVK
jgi:flagellar M-ring protein FliF